MEHPSAGQAIKSNSKKSGNSDKISDTLHVKVWSPFKVYFDGKADSVTGVNGTGAFDVLPRHRNFITLLEPCDFVLQTQDGEVKIQISGGVMHVRKNAVTVFLEV